jgi:hypothetical protein
VKKALPLIVIGVFGVLLIFLFINFNKMSQTSATPLNLNLPDKWQAFNRVTDQTGKDALTSFQKEHEAKISWKEGAKGDYSDGTQKFTLWIAGAVNDGNAAQMSIDMAGKIGKNNKVFSQPKAVDLGAAKGYRTEGQGNSNFFFAKGRQVYWIAVNGAADPEALAKNIVSDMLK